MKITSNKSADCVPEKGKKGKGAMQSIKSAKKKGYIK